MLNIDIPPRRMRHPSAPREKVLSPSEKAERIREIRESEEREQQENERVASKLLNKLEIMGLECPRCESKNVKEDRKLSEKDEDNFHLYCRDCRYKWTDPK